MPPPSHTPESILAEAINLAAPDQRAKYLSRACGDDHELRAEVERLVQDHFAAGDFLEEPAACVVDDLTNGDGQAQEQPGSWIGPYKLHEQIGEGGFGVVYLAVQEKPVRRQVALKIIKPGMDTKQVIARFEAERQALALMNHANIAQVLDAGETETGRPYFVMELVKGIPITEYCDQCNLTTHERLKLFMSLCNAVQHAHQKAIIHRDIKPTNVLVVFQDGEPTVKIIDFGVAKALNQRLTDRTLETGFAQMLGTPLYMSPEQAEMSTLDVDTRTDVYSLGVLLYELLTGTTPFTREQLDNATYDEIRNMIRREDPPRPSARLSTLGEQATTISERRRTDVRKLRQLYQGDLDWIVMRCLEKDRTRRYETANDLARDVGRFIGGEPVEARPPSIVYRLGKFARRNRGGLAAGLAAVVVLVGLIVGLAVSNHLITRERDRAVTGRNRAIQAETRATQLSGDLRRQLYVSDVNLAYQNYHEGNVARAVELLTRQRPEEGEADHRGIEWHYLYGMCQRSQIALTLDNGTGILAADVSLDSQRLATVGVDAVIRIWNLQTGECLDEIHHEPLLETPWPRAFTSLEFSPNGRQLAFCSIAGAQLWDLQTHSTITIPDVAVMRVAFARDGNRLALAGPRRIHIWNRLTGSVKTVHEYAEPGQVFALEFANNDSALAWTMSEETALWDGSRVVTISQTPIWAASLAFSPDDRIIARVGFREIELRETATGDLMRTLKRGYHGVDSLAFSVDGQTLAASGRSGLITLWDVQQGTQTGAIKGHGAVISALNFTGDGRWLVSTSQDGTARRWAVQSDKIPIFIEKSPGRIPLPVHVSADRLIAVSAHMKDRTTELLRRGLPFGTPEFKVQISSPRVPVGSGLWWPFWVQQRNGTRFIVSDARAADRIQVWDAASGAKVHELKGEPRDFSPLALSPDGRRMLQNSANGVKLWDLDSKQVLDAKSRAFDSAGFTPDNRIVCLGSNKLYISDSDSLDDARIVPLDQGARHLIDFSPDSSRMIASGTGTGLWAVHSGKKLASLGGTLKPGFPPGHFAFSPDSKLLANCSALSTVVGVWNATTGKKLTDLEGHRHATTGAAFSQDGHTLVSASADGSIKLWDLATLSELGNLHYPRDDGVFWLSMADDGTLAVSHYAGDMYVWPASSFSTE